jgi:hypothetical protein
MMCRKSGCFPSKRVALDTYSTKYLCRIAVSVTESGIFVNLQSAKTNQFGDTNDILPMYKNDKSDLLFRVVTFLAWVN